MTKYFIVIYLFLGVNILWSTSIDTSINKPITSTQLEGSRATDSLELVRFHQLTGGEDWMQKWDFEKPINLWFGVSLNENERVKCLDLDGNDNCDSEKNIGNNLTGNIPDLQLPFLEFIFLAGNNLTGDIPDFSGIPNLLMAQLCCNKFSGNIPNFSNFSNLVSLELDYNQLNGSVPNFSKMPFLENLYLSDNDLSETLPKFQFLKNMKRLYVQNNELTGTIPSLKENHLLEQVIVAQNSFEGRLPLFEDHTNLSRINFSRNQIKGSIPNWQHLEKLREVDLSNNYLTGTIPNFSNSTALKRLVLENNQFQNCSNFSSLQNLKYFSLKGNQLTFEDLFPLNKILLTNSTYENQESCMRDDIISFSKEEIIALDIPFDKEINSNNYRWFKDNEAMDAIMPSLVLDPTLRDINGVYFCKITNPNFPNLELKTGDFILKASTEIPNTGIPFAIDDQFEFTQTTNGKFQFNPIENDDLADVEYWELNFLTHPKTGFILSMNDFGQYEMNLPSNFAGNLEFEYEICNLEAPELCSIGRIRFVVAEKEENNTWKGSVTEAIAPHGGNLPSTFIVNTKDDTNAQLSLTICNQMGQVVYYKNNYKNTWKGTMHDTDSLLSAGVYFYHIVFKDTKQAISGSVAIVY